MGRAALMKALRTLSVASKTKTALQDQISTFSNLFCMTHIISSMAPQPKRSSHEKLADVLTPIAVYKQSRPKTVEAKRTAENKDMTESQRGTRRPSERLALRSGIADAFSSWLFPGHRKAIPEACSRAKKILATEKAGNAKRPSSEKKPQKYAAEKQQNAAEKLEVTKKQHKKKPSQKYELQQNTVQKQQMTTEEPSIGKLTSIARNHASRTSKRASRHTSHVPVEQEENEDNQSITGSLNDDRIEFIIPTRLREKQTPPKEKVADTKVPKHKPVRKIERQMSQQRQPSLSYHKRTVRFRETPSIIPDIVSPRPPSDRLAPHKPTESSSKRDSLRPTNW